MDDVETDAGYLAVLDAMENATCPKCGQIGSHQAGPGKGPHFASLRCGGCGRWLRWVAASRNVTRTQVK